MTDKPSTLELDQSLDMKPSTDVLPITTKTVNATIQNVEDEGYGAENERHPVLHRHRLNLPDTVPAGEQSIDSVATEYTL